MKVFRPNAKDFDEQYFASVKEALSVCEDIKCNDKNLIAAYVSWQQIPGGNTQGTNKWFKNEVWKKKLKDDFVKSKKYAPLPLAPYKDSDIIVKFYSVVWATSDKFNIGARYKKVQDLLQIESTSKTGRVTGMLGYIKNDKNFMPDVVEVVNRKKENNFYKFKLVVLIFKNDKINE